MVKSARQHYVGGNRRDHQEGQHPHGLDSRKNEARRSGALVISVSAFAHSALVILRRANLSIIAELYNLA